MPPASLSTLDVMRPGPTTAKKTTRRLRQARLRRMKSLPREFQAPLLAGDLVWSLMRLRLRSRNLAFCAQATDDVVHRDRADRMAQVVYDGEAAQIVFVEQLKNVRVFGICLHRKHRLECNFGH